MTYPISEDEDTDERRCYPRLDSNCPVLFREHTDAPWHIGFLINFSATGMLMQSQYALTPETKLMIQFMPGKNKSIPEIHADACVNRCEEGHPSGYRVACTLTKISISK